MISTDTYCTDINGEKNKETYKDEISHLYTMYYMQLIRVKNININNHKHKERTILNEYASSIKKFYGNRIKQLQNKLQNDLEISKNSYIGWSNTYYESEYNKKNELLNKLKHKIMIMKGDKMLDMELSIGESESENKNGAVYGYENEFSEYLIMPINIELYRKYFSKKK